MTPSSRFLLTLLFATSLLPAAAAPQPLDRIVAVVNDGVVLQSELERSLLVTKGQLRERGITAPPDSALTSQVLERLIIMRLQTQKAADAGIKVDDRELNDVLGNIAANNKMTLQQFVEALKHEGMDYPSIREQVRDEVLSQRVRQKEVGSHVSVSDQDVELALSNTTEADSTEYHLSHILIAVPDGASNEVREKTRAKARGLLKQLREGADFAKLAVENSDGQQALQGGDLDWRKGGDLPTLFSTVVPKLLIGQCSDLLEGNNGFNIIKLVDKRDGGERTTVTETKAQHILVKTNALRDEAQTAALIRDLYDRVAKGEDFAALAKKYSDDPGSKNGGGDLGWQAPGVLAPEFQAAVDALEPGQLSKPFTTQFGWHIARVVERRTRDATTEMRRNRVRQAIGTRKEAEEYEIWIRRLRAEAYVEYRMAPDTADSDAKPATSPKS
jgi:peptidyl-prolyl cis-trans isomerase SurA